jgi:hypothetical protein
VVDKELVAQLQGEGLLHGANPVERTVPAVDDADEDTEAVQNDQEGEPAGNKRKTKENKKIVLNIKLLARPPAEPAPPVLLSPSSTKNLDPVRGTRCCFPCSPDIAGMCTHVLLVP